MAYIRKKCGYYSVRWRAKDGSMPSHRCPDKKTADKVRRLVEEAQSLGMEWNPYETDEPPAVKEILAGYITNCARRSEPSTVRRYATCLDVFMAWLKKEHPEGEHATANVLSLSLLEDFYDYALLHGRHDNPREVDTTRKIVEAVQRAWKWGYNEDKYDGLMPTPKTMDMKPTSRNRTVAPTWKEMDQCIAVCGGWHRQLAVLLRFTGLRVQQAMKLRWEDFELDTATLNFRGKLGKTMKEKAGREIPVSWHLVRELETWKPPEERHGWIVECGRDADGPRGREARARDMARAWKRAGVREVAWKGQPHQRFRKGFRSGLKRLGADGEAVEYLIGHYLGLVSVYQDPDDLPLRETVDLIPPLPTLGKLLEFASKRGECGA